jgi:hypothetical protein
MADPDDVLDRLAELKAEYRRLDAAREKVKEQLVETAVEAFRLGKEAADIYANNPLSDVWLRGRVREAGVPRAKPGTKPKASPGGLAVTVTLGTPAAGPTQPDA